MSEVKRYSVAGFSDQIEQDISGDFVMHDDYAELERQLEEKDAELKDVYKDRLFLKGDNDSLKAKLAEAVARIKELELQLAQQDHNDDAESSTSDLLSKSLERIKELESRIDKIAHRLCWH